MSICSATFLCFATLVVLGWHGLHASRARELLLLVANLAFFASLAESVSELVPMVLFLAAGYAAVRARARWAIVVLVGAFCWLKKYWFLAPVGFLDKPYVTIGFSYVLFRVLHLVIDSRTSSEIAGIRPLAYVNYTLGFTALVAGPIHRFEDYARPPLPVDFTVVRASLERIAGGYFKLVVVAPALGTLHGAALKAFDGVWLHNVLAGAACLAAWPLFLYFNFSGYVDIVVGIARLIGVALPENFNRPFEARSFIEFWARYHMTLSNWLRDYVYAPLLRVMMTRLPPGTPDVLLGLVACFVTFFLIGIWHGPTAMFALYGVMLAVGVSINKLYQVAMVERLGRARYKTLAAGETYAACARGLTFTWYSLSMVCFWSSAGQASGMLKALGLAGTLGCISILFVAATVVPGGLQWARAHLERLGTPHWRAIGAAAAVLACVIVRILSDSAAPDVIYKAF
jgi:D-alanyl-lipoteichoic acid acyltransferase DltB (MBOAT superfamily)